MTGEKICPLLSHSVFGMGERNRVEMVACIGGGCMLWIPAVIDKSKLGTTECIISKARCGLVKE